MRPIQPQDFPSSNDADLDESVRADATYADSRAQYRRWRGLAEIGFMLAILYGLIVFAMTSVTINDDSMRPNLSSGQMVMVNRLSYRLTQPRRGDVVALHNPRDTNQFLVRRVLGLPGETVDIVGNQVSINGRTLTEVYLDPSSLQVLVGQRQVTRRQYRLSANEYFVLSDKRASGIDSRDWGTISPDAIEGRAALVYWPPEDISSIPHALYEEQAVQ